MNSILACEKGMNHWKRDSGIEPEKGEDGPARCPSLGLEDWRGQSHGLPSEVVTTQKWSQYLHSSFIIFLTRLQLSCPSEHTLCQDTTPLPVLELSTALTCSRSRK